MPSVEESPDLEHRRRPHAIPAFVGPLVRSRHTKPCPTYFEVSFLDSKSQREPPHRLDAIVFRNFYCSHITIKRRRQLDGAKGGGIDSDPWVTILRNRPLMEDPHYEDDAQYWHVITADEFEQTEFGAGSTAPLRIYLYQPSPMWKTIGLQHVKCVSWAGVDSKQVNVEGVTYSSGKTEVNLGDLCRGISDQVQIFGGKRRAGPTS